jgi:hypothetical protein
MLRRVVSGMVLALILLNMFSVVAGYPNEPHNANAMWIEPSSITLYTALHSIGYKFNVTVWLNVSSVPSPNQVVLAWQTKVAYDRAYLNATRTGYTAGAKSQFFENITNIIVAPVRGNLNATHDYIMHGEAWGTGPMRALGYGSLNWIEFEVLSVPAPEDGNITSVIGVFTTGPGSRSRVFDGDWLDVSFTPYHCNYLFLCVSPPPKLTVDPTYKEYDAFTRANCSYFNTTIWLKDLVTEWNLVNTSFCLCYNSTLLETVNANITLNPDGVWNVTTGNLTTPGEIDFYAERTCGTPPLSGNVRIAIIEFQVIYQDTVPPRPLWDYDETELSFCNVAVSNHTQNITSILEEGKVRIYCWLIPYRDVATIEVNPYSTDVTQGESVDINVIVENQGFYTETFNVTAYANTTPIDTLTDVTLTSFTSTIITFTWNTTGVTFGYYTIWAEASIVPEENDTSDNTLIDGEILVRPGFHDVAIANVRTSQNFAYQGESVSIYVDVWNIGDFPETFNVTTYADENSTIIGDEITIETLPLTLPSKGLTPLIFTWSTTGVSPGNYTISAVASNVTEEADPTDNLYINGKIEIFVSIPCYDINITSPTYVELNPSIFHFDWTVRALEVSLGNMAIDSTGYEGLLRVLGSTNGTVHLRVDQPNLEFACHYLAQNTSINVPLWLLFDPGTYSGTYELQLTVCGTHRLKITINIISISVCHNGAYAVAGGTATFNWTITGGSWVYLEAEPNLPIGWDFVVDPPIGTLFETPHEMFVNITVAPDAKEGDIGSVTLRAYKNATNTLIWQYTFFASTDNKSPTIQEIDLPTLTFNGDLLFNATVKDASGIESVQLNYSVNDGPWNNQTMQWGSGDTFNSTSYTLTIPHVPDDSTIKYYAVATDWLGNQTQSDIETIVVKYDVAITEVKTSKTVVGQGFATQINVSIANHGTIPNTSLKVVIYANTTPIHIQTLPLLTNGTATTLTFYWDTTNVPKGNYVITASAIPLLDETDTTDNTLIGGTIKVGIPGDVDPADGYVGIDDIFNIALRFGTEPGGPPNSNGYYYSPVHDINNDLYIGIDDIFTAASHFGEENP